MESATENWEPQHWKAAVDPKRRYRMLRVAFALGAFSLGLLALDGSCWLLYFLGDSNLDVVLRSRLWDWLVGASITWGTFFCSFLLISPFDNLRWRRLAILLLIMNALDLGLWWTQHAEIIGPGAANLVAFKPSRLAELAVRFFGLAELFIFGFLARDVLLHLDRPNETRAFETVRWSASIGAGLHLVFCFQMISWKDGRWIVAQAIPNKIDAIFPFLAGMGALTVCAFATTFLCAAACFQSSLMFKELVQAEKEATSG